MDKDVIENIIVSSLDGSITDSSALKQLAYNYCDENNKDKSLVSVPAIENILSLSERCDSYDEIAYIMQKTMAFLTEGSLLADKLSALENESLSSLEIIQQAKKRFLKNELVMLTMMAALATRSSEWPVYAVSSDNDGRDSVKERIRKVLVMVEEQYQHRRTEKYHIAFIADMAKEMTIDMVPYLHRGTFRIGVTQKLINMYLKYLWVVNIIPEPPHCPIDGIIRDKAGLNYNWISNDSIDDYLKAVTKIRHLAKSAKPKPLSIAQWELIEFSRIRTATA